MISLVYNLCANVEDWGTYIGSIITVVIDIIASIIFLIKAIKSKNVTLKDALKGIIKIFSRKNKENADEVADEIVEELKGEDEKKENDDVQQDNS